MLCPTCGARQEVPNGGYCRRCDGPLGARLLPRQLDEVRSVRERARYRIKVMRTDRSRVGGVIAMLLLGLWLMVLWWLHPGG